MTGGDDRLGAREEILLRVREVMGGATPDTFPSRLLLKREWDVEERFIQEFSRIGGVVHRAGSPEEAARALQELVQSAGAARAIRWNSSLMESLRVDDALAVAGVQVFTPSPRDQQEYGRDADSAQVGITEVDYAVAETGTLVLLADPKRPRATSLLPRVHVALLPKEAILSTFDELFSQLSSKGVPPSAMTFITGPSRTADIEMTPVIGVHGPQAVHVILLNFPLSEYDRD